jgi:hypothetical protein
VSDSDHTSAAVNMYTCDLADGPTHKAAKFNFIEVNKLEKMKV